MAKPGSNHARRIAQNGSVDLSRAGMSDAQAWAAQAKVELMQGKRCSGCGKRIGLGFEFTSIDVTNPEPVIRLAACTRHDCDFAERAREGATYMEAVEIVWFDDAGIDAPAVELRAVPRT